MKQCSHCKRLLSLDCFNNNKSTKDNLGYWCKNCEKQYRQQEKEYFIKYRQENKEKITEYEKKWAQDNKEKRREISKRYYQNHKEKVNKYTQRYYQNHKEKARKYSKEYRQNNKEKRRKNLMQRRKNPKYKLNDYIGNTIRQSLKNQNISKNGKHWESLVNFTLQELIARLENLFQDGMTWENQGKWHIDHIKPISLFNFKSIDDLEFKECWSLENLQPLWAEDNMRKHNKYIDSF